MPVSISGTNGVTFPDSSLQAAAASPYVLKNRIINGAMGIWQRGTTLSAVSTGTYLADRWKCTLGGTSLTLTMSQDTTVPNINYLYSLKFQQLSNNATSVSEFAARQTFELANVRDLAGNSITISFWYKSNVTGTHGVRILPLGTTGGIDTVVAITVNSANTWEYKTVTTTALSAITSWGSTADNGLALILDIGLLVGGQATKTINANDYFNLTGVQLEIGTSATPFERRLYGQELANCQRYLPCFDATSGYLNVMGYTYAANSNIIVFTFPVQARVQPTGITTTALSTLGVYNGTNALQNPSAFIINISSLLTATCLTTQTSGFTAGQPCRLEGASAKILFTGCEL